MLSPPLVAEIDTDVHMLDDIVTLCVPMSLYLYFLYGLLYGVVVYPREPHLHLLSQVDPFLPATIREGVQKTKTKREKIEGVDPRFENAVIVLHFEDSA